MKREKLLEEFNNYYKEIYNERWEALKESFLRDKNYITIPDLNGEYFIDEASYFITRLIEIKDNDVILDACSSPGGKALSLLNRLNSTNSLFCNELSRARKERLQNNLNIFVPTEKKHIIKDVTNYDACKIGLFRKEVYDKILLDVPCSSERHILKYTKLVNNWSMTKSKKLKIQSHTILQSALMALKPKGSILYSTCSISPLENDEVIKRTLKKDKYPFKVIEIYNLPTYVEKTEFGYQIFPDNSDGRGPIYFSLLKKE